MNARAKDQAEAEEEECWAMNESFHLMAAGWMPGENSRRHRSVVRAPISTRQCLGPGDAWGTDAWGTGLGDWWDARRWTWWAPIWPSAASLGAFPVADCDNSRASQAGSSTLPFVLSL